MFTTPCLIRKNTKELRDWLTLIGYQYGGQDANSGAKGIYCNKGEFFEVYKYTKPSRDFKIIDCGENMDMFKAIAALRDDSPFMQYFIYEKRTLLNKVGKWIICYHKGSNLFGKYIKNGTLRKATVEELIEHFK